MADNNWIKEFPVAITVCDRHGVILEMNDQSASIFQQEGGRELIGKNLLDCHPEPARSKLRELLATGKPNVYTIEKAGRKKLIYQAPWFQEGQYQGLVECSLEIPWEIPHFVRK